MKRMLMVMLGTAMLAAAPARAEQVDLATITCKKFFEYSKENLSIMLMWLDGYYAEDDAPPVVDFDKMAVNAKKLGDYCGKNPDHSVITAADKVIGKDK